MGFNSAFKGLNYVIFLQIFLQFFCFPWEWLLRSNTSDRKQPFCWRSVRCRFYCLIIVCSR